MNLARGKLPCLILLFLCLARPARSEGLLPALTEAQIQQARKLLAEFKSNPRGPYLRIRWFCNDGTVHPPSPPPCASRGGGYQHAVLSPAALRLAEWNIDVGTILAGLRFEQFLDADRDNHRLKELVLEKYLAEVDHGWIYRRARYYRGARQAEDEEKAGRRLLAQLLSDPAWVRRNYFLANQLVAAVPHGAADSVVQKVRALAKAVADRDVRFQPIRVKIHSQPGPDDLSRVEQFLAEQNPSPSEREQLVELASLLRQQQSNQNLAAQLPAVQKRLAGSPLAARLADLASALRKRSEEEILSVGASLSFEIRRRVSTDPDGRRNLDLLDLNALVLENAFRAEMTRSSRAGSPKLTRREQLADLLENFRYAAGAGLLSAREFEALRPEIESLEKSAEVRAERYQQAIRYLARATEWCRAGVAEDFGPLARHYQEVEPLAASLQDHLLRGSVALPLSSRLDVLVADANEKVGIRHSILGEPSSRGIVALNPGVALGPLAILRPGQEQNASIDPDRIYVIPETLADLKPMAGILTLDSGNALSHAQLLAASLGIPNATIPSSLLPVLEKYQGQELLLAVTPRGVVVLKTKAELTPAERQLWEQPASAKPRIELDTSRLNLADRRIRALTGLGTKDSGVIAGPKAANLGQLASVFPDKVAPGLVLPFGIYYEHVNRVLDSPMGGAAPLLQEITDAFAEAERLRQGGAGAAEIGKFIYPRLARFRGLIQSMPLIPALEKDLLSRMRAEFGPEGSYGVFVRSDTNAEDLPEFTGAGLNLTVPNRVGNRNILQAIKDVWASPFTERAYDWRSQVLRFHERVYPSVILMHTVASEKSGVIATVNLETGNTDEITVNVSEGFGAVVDGGVAESLLLKPNGEVRLLQQVRSPYKKVALPTGGVENRPTSDDEYVLAPGEIAQLRQMVAEVKAKYPPVKNDAGQTLPWDIEFGFEKGQLRLFQIRPLVRYQELKTLEALGQLEARVETTAAVRLDERP